MTKNTFFFAFMIVFAGVASAQEVRISGNQVVASDSTWTVNAGTTVVFGPNSSVEVLGGLEFLGTEDMPIRITSLDPYEGTGLGFLINGQSNTYINLNNIIVNNLQTPFRFDPFWYRSRATLSNVQFYENNQEHKRNAPIVSVGVPFLRLEQPATLNLTGLYFANNYGGVVIDGLGQNGANFFLNGLAFEYNEGFDQYNTPLHLELSGNAANYTISNLLFNQNESYGLSVGGIDGALNIENIYLNTRESASNIIDKNTNYRLPLVEGDRLDLAYNPIAPGFVTQALFLDQEPGSVIVERAQGSTSVPTMLFDADGSAIEFNSIETDRGLELSYTQGLPSFAVFGNGTLAWIKPLAVEEMPEPLYDFSKKGMGSGFSDMLKETGIADWTSKKMDQLLHPKNKPGFEESWEAGGTFGGTLYDGRDLKMMRFSTQDISGFLPNIGMLWPGGAIGYTGGGFLSYNRGSHTSFKASLSLSNINAGKPRSFPYRFTNSAVMNRTINVNGNIIPVTHAFSTSVESLELEALRHLTANQITLGKKFKLVPSLTAGIGVMHFTPYAIQSVATSNDAYSWYLFNTKDIHANLRNAGTAGQIHIDGMSPYRSFALIASTGVSLSFVKPNWRLNAQLKGNITTTDYLDDFSRGTYFGGDFYGWLESLPDYTYTDPLTGMEENMANSAIGRTFQDLGSRAQNYMTDGFWQIQFSFSKDIDSEKITKYYQPIILANVLKVRNWWQIERGKRITDNAWEAGAWFGAAFYDGRDLRYKKLLNLAPMPTNIELSQGLYIQKNSYQKYSWNVGLNKANMSYARTQTPLQVAGGRNILSYNNEPNSSVVRATPRAYNFFTRTSSVESNIYYHFRDYELPEGKKFWFVPSFGLGLGVMNFTPYREVRGLNVGDPSFLMWKRARAHYVDLREVGSEGQQILPNGRAYGKWAGLYSASFQLSMHTSKWIYKAEIKSNMTTTDYLDDFGRGAWYGGNRALWEDALDVSYFNANTGEEVPITVEQLSYIPSDFNLFTPRATNNLMDGYLQIHIGIAKKL